MPLAVQICLIVVSIAVVWLAVMAIRALSHTIILIENANRSLAELPGLIEDAKRMSARTEALVLSFSQITQSARGHSLGILDRPGSSARERFAFSISRMVSDKGEMLGGSGGDR